MCIRDRYMIMALPYDQFGIRACLEKYVAYYERITDLNTFINYCYDKLYIRPQPVVGTGDISIYLRDDNIGKLKRALEYCTNLEQSFAFLPQYNDDILIDFDETIVIIDAIYTPFVCFQTYLHGDYKTLTAFRAWYNKYYNSVTRRFTAYDNDLFNNVAMAIERMKRHTSIEKEYSIHIRAITLFTGLSHLPRIISVSYTHLRAHETPEHLVCRLLL